MIFRRFYRPIHDGFSSIRSVYLEDSGRNLYTSPPLSQNRLAINRPGRAHSLVLATNIGIQFGECQPLVLVVAATTLESYCW